MRIGVNLTPLTFRGGGMRQYLLQLLPCLVDRSCHEYLLFAGDSGLPSLAGILRRFSVSGRVQLIRVESAEDIRTYGDRFDLLFCPLNNFAPLLLDRPTVATLADIQEQYYPQYFTPEPLAGRREHYPRMARLVTLLLTISEFSRQTIIERFGIEPDKVRVTHLAPSEELFEQQPTWSRTPRLPEQFFLYPANLYPHKNHELLLRALRRARATTRLDLRCIFTGHEATPGIDLRQRAAAHGLADAIEWFPHVSGAELRYLYEHATALAFPSEFEGFGLPLVEAMRLGCPVLAANTSSVPEVVGDAAMLLPPDEAQWAEALTRLVQDRELRASLRERGLERARAFHVEQLADQTLKALDDAWSLFQGVRCSGSAVTYVVPARGTGKRLAQTLRSAALEMEPGDEVLVLGRAVPAEAGTLVENMSCARVLNEVDWIDEVRTPLTCYVLPGTDIAQGAGRTAKQCRAQAKGTLNAIIGSSLMKERDGKCPRPMHVSEPGGTPFDRALVPSGSVFWSTDYLRSHRAVIAGKSWPMILLHGLNEAETATRPRAFCLVEREQARALRLSAWKCMQLWSLRRRGLLSFDPRALGSAYLGDKATRLKQRIRRWTRNLPVGWESWLRGWYRRHVRSRVGGR